MGNRQRGRVIVGRGLVEAFLREMFTLYDAGMVEAIERQETKPTLMMLGLTPQDAMDEVRNLHVDEYWSGPEDEIDQGRPPGDIWVFKRKICGNIIYIKIKINTKRNMLIFVSFHTDKPS